MLPPCPGALCSPGQSGCRASPVGAALTEQGWLGGVWGQGTPGDPPQVPMAPWPSVTSPEGRFGDVRAARRLWAGADLAAAGLGAGGRSQDLCFVFLLGDLFRGRRRSASQVNRGRFGLCLPRCALPSHVRFPPETVRPHGAGFAFKKASSVPYLHPPARLAWPRG